MRVGSGSHALLLVLLVASAGWGAVRASCVPPPNGMQKLVTSEGSVLWSCMNPSATLPNLQRVVKSQCEDSSLIEEEVTCEISLDFTAISSCTAEPPAVANAATEVLIADVALVYKCSDGHGWLSWETERVSQCYKGAWTPVQDMCDTECTMPRDCAEVNKLGHVTPQLYTVHPSGDRLGPAVTVYCHLDAVEADGGWLLVVNKKTANNDASIDTTDATNGFSDPHSPPYFLGLKHLAAMHWDGDEPRPLVYEFMVKLTGEEPFKHTTYTHVQLTKEAPWNLTISSPYHGDAGDIFNSTNLAWDDGGDLVSLLGESSPQWFGRPIDWLYVYVRPVFYDQATSCPALVGLDNTWQHTWAQVPQSRANGARIHYRCPGALRVRSEATDGLVEITNTTEESNTATEDEDAMGNGFEGEEEDGWSKEGFVECKRNASGELVWSASLELPCSLTCPDNFTTSADGLSCIRIYHDDAEFGITSASLRCHEDGASLSPIDRVPADSSLFLPDRYYYTASLWRQGDWTPSHTVECAGNGQCNGGDEKRCFVIRPTDGGVFEGKARACARNDTGFICTWPAWCPDDYKPYKGLCLKVTADIAKIPDSEPDYKEGMLDCMKEGAALAYPESLGAMNFLAHLVREKENNISGQPYRTDLSEEKTVITGLYGGDADWTGGGVYSPDPEVLQLAGEDTEKFYRLLQVPQTLGQNATLMKTNFFIGSLEVHYAACQLYGLADCPGELPLPGANMTLSQSSESTRYNSTIGYECYPGYFSDGNVTWPDQWVMCFASMGGWAYLDRPEIEPFVDCIPVEVCNDTTVIETVGPKPNVTFSEDHLYLNGTIDITCPRRLTTQDGNTTQALTCSANNQTFDYVPEVLPCNVCEGDPYLWNANYTYDENATYVIGDTINATCDDLHMTKQRENETQIVCWEWGWGVYGFCYKVCLDPLPVPGANITIEEEPDDNVTIAHDDKALYTCSPGTYIPQSYPNVKSKLNYICKNGKWKPSVRGVEQDPYCAVLCLDDPPTSPPLNTTLAAPVETSWDGINRTVGAQVELWCTEDRVLPDLTNTTGVECGENGNWTDVGLDPLICRRVATEPPPLPPGSVMEGPEPPNYWEGDVVVYICPPDTLSPAGTNTTTAHFNGSVWTLNDTEFQCLPMCTMDPPTPSAPGNSTWDGWTRIAYTQVELTCPDPYFFTSLNNSINITCHNETLKWTHVDPGELLCRILATEPPPLPPGSVIEGPEAPNYWEGDVVGYRCPPDKLSPTGTNTTTAHFNGSHWMLNDTEFQCLPVCWTDPPTPQGPGNSTWDGSTRFANTSVELTCPDPYLFAHLNTSITATCDPHTLNWTLVDACLSNDTCDDDSSSTSNLASTVAADPTCSPDNSPHAYDSYYDDPKLLHCRRLAVEPPPIPPETEIMCPEPPHYWEGDVVRYRCLPNKLSYAGTNTTTAHFNGSHWVLEDPAFECLPMCSGPPPRPRSHMVWVYAGGEVWGAVATYICDTHFLDGNKTLNSTCIEGNWTITELPQCEVVEPESGPQPLSANILPDEDVHYSQTTIYHWPTAPKNMTTSDGGADQFLYTDGPSGFGNAVELVADSKQCLVHKNFIMPVDACTGNPKNCSSGLSLSVWYKGKQGLDRDWEFITQDPNDPSVIESIVSTGGDMKGHPGLFLYQQGMTTTAVVSTGAEYWSVSSIGMIRSDKWTNLGMSWSKDSGLQLYIDRTLVGSVKYPSASPGALPALKPPEMMLGCHKDAKNTTYRGFNAAAFDELAIWNKSLVGDKVMYFMGGYVKEYEDVSLEDMNALVDGADLNNPDIAAAAFEITAQKTYSEEVPSGGSVTPTAATTAATTTTSTDSDSGGTPTTTADTAMTTVQPDSEEEEDFDNLLKLHKKFSKSAPKGVEIHKLNKILGLVGVVSNIFSEKNKEFLEEQVTEMLNTEDGEKEDTIDPNEIVQDLSNWTMQVMQNINFGNRTEMFTYVKDTDNFIVNLFKAPLSEFTQGNSNFVVAPKCSMMSEKDSWNNTCNRAAVSNFIVRHPNCSDRIVNLAITNSRNLHSVSPASVNTSVLNSHRPHELNSMMISVEMSADPALTSDGKMDKKAPQCNPDPSALLETPVRLKLFHLHSDSHPHQRRKLLFHENEIVKRVESRHCVWWNANVSGWDSTGCVVMFETELYTKCACARFGTFAVMDQLVEPRVAPEEHLWLTILRYIGYGLSIFFIIVYIIVVLVSRDLKDQFHLMGVNAAVAVLVGAAAMVTSDLHAVRDDRHWCTAIGTLLHFFCQAAGAWVFCLGHAAHRAVTAGVIGGRLRSYLTISWGLPLISVGLTYLLYLMDLGQDPRCFISWENPPKWVFFGFQIVFVIVSGACACVVLCNMATTALRKDNLIDDYGSFCHGAAYLLLFFDVTWLFGIPCYLRLGSLQTDFYPIFQVLNSWTGVVLFLFIGLASRRFKMVVAGQAKLRREMLKGYAFGKPGKMKKDAKEPLSSSSSPAVKAKTRQPKAKPQTKSAESKVAKPASPRSYTAD